LRFAFPTKLSPKDSSVRSLRHALILADELMFYAFCNLQEEIHERPQITSMIGSLANYSNTIPSAPAEGTDGKAPAPAARMGKLSGAQSEIQISFSTIDISFLSLNRHTYRMLLAMYPEHFRCDIVHSIDMGRWNGWRHLWLCYRFNMLLCGKISLSLSLSLSQLLQLHVHFVYGLLPHNLKPEKQHHKVRNFQTKFRNWLRRSEL